MSDKVSEYKYKFELGIALLPLICILFAFGGRLCLTVLCFGGLSIYILDLLGAVEVNI